MALSIRGITRRYGEVQALAGIDLDVPSGSTVALLGPSGCGKSTLLRIVAGLEPPDHGSVHLLGRDLADVPAKDRNVGMVFQDYALFPHLTVRDNVAFSLVERRWPHAERARRTDELLERMGLEGLDRRKPHELSGGQQQRVALARALASRPTTLLLDEPLSNLDRNLRESLMDDLAALLDDLDVRALHVTHDFSEACALADHVALMRDGAIVRTDTPTRLVENPGSAWVARFLGLRELFEGSAAKALGFDGPVLARVERWRPAPDGRAFVVRAVRRGAADLDLVLFERLWNVEVRYRVRPRELDVVPAVGDTLSLRIPDDAFTVLERQV